VLAPDGDCVVLVARTGEAATDQNSVRVPVKVDGSAPVVQPRRPTLNELKAAAKRAAAARDRLARDRAAWRHWHRHHSARHGQRYGVGDFDRDGDVDWDDVAARYDTSLPITYTLPSEAAQVDVTATVGGRTTHVGAWSEVGSQRLRILLPAWTKATRMQLAIVAKDEAGNASRTSMSLVLPALPAPKTTRTPRSTDPSNGGSSTAPVNDTTPVGTALPEWLRPIMLRATYAAGVPQSWASSKALANIIQHESGYRPTAQNPTSTAYGMFQFLNTTWATVGCTKTSDAYQQSVCGLRYIERRYHTPERAWAFWQAQSPHWY
jgi:hypothetical protein